IETTTASGAATATGRRRASSGTPTSASPKPTVERINVATKITNTMYTAVASIIAALGVGGPAARPALQLYVEDPRAQPFQSRTARRVDPMFAPGRRQRRSPP